MKYLLLSLLLISACSRQYSTPLVGMPESDFQKLCKPGVPTSTTTKDGITHVYDLRTYECSGKFTFVNEKLTIIEK